MKTRSKSERNRNGRTKKGKERRKTHAEKDAAFRNVKNQIGFCGIWCGSCVAGNGTLRELTKRYEEITNKYGLGKWCPKDFDYGEFSKGLASIQGMPLCPGCLKGGGRDDCEIRTCASNRRLQDCTECNERAECKHGEILEKMRSGAIDAGLLVKVNGSNRQALLQEWTVALKTKWPSCILFSE